jgi:hypothetical protein
MLLSIQEDTIKIVNNILIQAATSSLITLDKLHVILITNYKCIGWTKKSTNTNSSFDFIVYILSHVIKMRLF